MEKGEFLIKSKKRLKKIYVLGPAGSGKSFLAKRLSELMKINSYDMDDVRFIRKYTEARSKEERKKLVDKILRNKEWIIDARGTDWDRHAMDEADIIIQLETPFHKRTLRILKRYWKRRKDPDLNETFWDQFHLIAYSLSYRFGKRVTSYKSIKRFLEENNLRPVTIKNKKQLNRVLENFK